MGAVPPTPVKKKVYTTGADLAPWDFIISEFDGTNLGDITDGTNITMKFQLNGPSTFTATIPIKHRAFKLLTDRSHGQDVLVKAYRYGRLKDVFSIKTGQIVGGGDQQSLLAITAIQTAYDAISERLAGVTGWVPELPQLPIGFQAAGDRIAACAWCLAEINADFHSQVLVGTIGTGAYIETPNFKHKRFLDFVNEVSNTWNGFDWWLEPWDPLWSGAWQFKGSFNAVPLRGSVRKQVQFTYGPYSRQNMRDYSYAWDRTNQATRASSLYTISNPDGAWDGITIATIRASLNYAALEWVRMPRKHIVVDTDLTDTDLVADLLDFTLYLREPPQRIFTFQPTIDDNTGQTPAFLEDYFLGDVIRGRVEDQGVLMLDAFVRVYGANISLDENGIEETELVVVMSGDQGAT
jgi:hypothetical protein